MFSTLIKHEFFDQSKRAQGRIYVINENKIFYYQVKISEMLIILYDFTRGKFSFGICFSMYKICNIQWNLSRCKKQGNFFRFSCQALGSNTNNLLHESSNV